MWNVIGVHKALQSKQDWNTHRNTGSKLAGSTYKGFSLTEPFQIHRKRLELALIEASLKNCNSEKELHLYVILNSNHSSWPLLLATLAHTATQPLFPPSTQVAAGDSSTGREQTQCSQPSALLLGFYCSPKGCAAGCTQEHWRFSFSFPDKWGELLCHSACRQGALSCSEGLQQGPAWGLLLKPPQKAVQWDMLWGLVTWHPLWHIGESELRSAHLAALHGRLRRAESSPGRLRSRALTQCQCQSHLTAALAPVLFVFPQAPTSTHACSHGSQSQEPCSPARHTQPAAVPAHRAVLHPWERPWGAKAGAGRGAQSWLMLSLKEWEVKAGQPAGWSEETAQKHLSLRLTAY